MRSLVGLVRHSAQRVYDNLRFARFNRFEVAGSLGDMGTFLPLLTGMAALNGLDIASALFFAGLFNVVTGVVFTIPMAVQPMKAIATVAISEGLRVHEILAAGIATSAVVLVLGLLNVMDRVQRWIPKSVLRGLQLGLGLKLLISGIRLITETHVWLGADSILVGALCFAVVLLTFFSQRVPGALVVFCIGLGMILLENAEVFAELRLEVTFPGWASLGLQDFVRGAWKAAIPQVPLTLLNSVVAVSALSWDLFPDRGARAKPIALSVGVMNLMGCWFGAMPMCHGAGGLAGQYRFGARTNGSILFLGVVKMMVAVFLGGTILKLLSAYPRSILGAMLLFSGLELALVARDTPSRTDFFIVLLTAGLSLAVDSTAVGFAIGVVVAYLFYKGVLKIEKVGENHLR